MATVQDFYPYIMPAVQGCPTAIVKNAIRHAINEFCEKTLIWRYTLTAVDVDAGVSSYAMDAPDGTVIIAPVYVAISDNILGPSNIEDLDLEVPGWRVSTANTSTIYYMDNASNLNLIPIPAEDIVGGLAVEVALKMDLTADTCPDWLFQNWVEAIAHGALMRLHAMPGHVWSDTNTVGYHKAKFRDGISRAKSRTTKSFLKQSKTVQPRQFWQ